MNRPRYEVPPELTNLLLEFTVNVMIEHPTDLVDYAARYFSDLRDERERNAVSGSTAVPSSATAPPALAENDDLIYSDEEEPMPTGGSLSIEDSVAVVAHRAAGHHALPPIHDKPLRDPLASPPKEASATKTVPVKVPSLPPPLPKRGSPTLPVPAPSTSSSAKSLVPLLPPPPAHTRLSETSATPPFKSRNKSKGPKPKR